MDHYQKKYIVCVVFCVILAVMLLMLGGFGAWKYLQFNKLASSVMYAAKNSIGQPYSVVPTTLPLPQPDPSPQGYSLPTALFLADMTLRLERFVNGVDAALELPPGVTQLFTDRHNMVLVASFTLNGKVGVVCAFRGTIHTSEWKKDFMFDLVPFQYGVDCSVHKGFQKIYGTFRDDIFETIKQAAPTTVFVCGHSLGAGLSLFLTLDLAKARTNADIRTYTFAPPRAGDDKCTSALERFIDAGPVKEWLQVVNSNDIVPLIPPAVSPNIWKPKHPLMYSHVLPLKFLRFSENLYSWQNNHSLSTYIHFLKTTVGK